MGIKVSEMTNDSAPTVDDELYGLDAGNASRNWVLVDVLDVNNDRVITYTGKSISLASNTIIGTKSEFDTALTDGTFAFLNQANSFTADQDLSDNDLLGVDNIIADSNVIHNWDIGRDTAIGDGVDIGFLRWRAHEDVGGSPILGTYAQISARVQDESAATEDARMLFQVYQNGVLGDTRYLMDGQNGAHEFTAANVLEFRITGAGIGMPSGNRLALDNTAIGSATQHITGDGTTIDYVVPTGESHRFQVVDGTNIFTISGTEGLLSADFKIQRVDATANIVLDRADDTPTINDVIGQTIYRARNDTPSQFAYATMRATIISGTAGSETGTFDVFVADGSGSAVRAYYANGNTKEFILDNGFDINLSGNLLEFDSTGTQYIQGDGSTIDYIVPTGESHRFQVVDGTDILTVAGTNVTLGSSVYLGIAGGGRIRWDGATERSIVNNTNGFEFRTQTADNYKFIVQTTEVSNISTTGSLFQLEKTNADTDVATFGQFWTRDDAPNTPMFTRDDGEDIELDKKPRGFFSGSYHDDISTDTREFMLPFGATSAVSTALNQVQVDSSTESESIALAVSQEAITILRVQAFIDSDGMTTGSVDMGLRNQTDNSDIHAFTSLNDPQSNTHHDSGAISVNVDAGDHLDWFWDLSNSAGTAVRVTWWVEYEYT